jgi:hypothetical protein
MKQKLSRIAALHERVAAEIDTANGVGNGRTHKVGEHGLGLYQLHFLFGSAFIATHPFEAETDIAALAMAYTLKEACSDLADRFELWQGSRVIARSADQRGPKHLPHLTEITARMQERVLQTEEMLLESRQAIAGSRELLLATQRLRSSLDAHT